MKPTIDGHQHLRARRAAIVAGPAALILSLIGVLWSGPVQANPATAGPVAAAAPAAPAKGAGAWVRAAHLIPEVGPMTIGLTPFAGDQPAPSASSGISPAPEKDGMRAIASAAAYGQVTEYQQVPAGFYTITVRPQGAAAGTPPMISGTLKAEAGQAFTVAGLGTKAAPRIEALTDDLTPPKAGQTRVRLLPAASTAKTVTVKAKNGPTVAENAAFGQPTGYAAVPSGPWTLRASADGSAATAATSKVNLSGGSVYTLLVLDSGRGLKVTPVVDASGMDVMPAGGAQTGGGGMAPATGFFGRVWAWLRS